MRESRTQPYLVSMTEASVSDLSELHRVNSVRVDNQRDDFLAYGGGSNIGLKVLLTRYFRNPGDVNKRGGEMGHESWEGYFTVPVRQAVQGGRVQ